MREKQSVMLKRTCRTFLNSERLRVCLVFEIWSHENHEILLFSHVKVDTCGSGWFSSDHLSKTKNSPTASNASNSSTCRVEYTGGCYYPQNPFSFRDMTHQTWEKTEILSLTSVELTLRPHKGTIEKSLCAQNKAQRSVSGQLLKNIENWIALVRTVVWWLHKNRDFELKMSSHNATSGGTRGVT